MSATAAVYVVTHDMHESLHVRLALEKIRPAVDRMLVIVPQKHLGDARKLLGDIGITAIEAYEHDVDSYLGALRQGLLTLRPDADRLSTIIVSGSGVFGPIADLPAEVLDPTRAGAAVFAPYYLDVKLARQEADYPGIDRIPHFDFTSFGMDLLRDPDFWAWVEQLPEHIEDATSFLRGPVALTKLLKAKDLTVCYPKAAEKFETADPRLFEVHKFARDGGPVISTAVMFLDPVIHDLTSIYLRQALDELRGSFPDMYFAIMQFGLKKVRNRDFCMISEQYRIMSMMPAHPDKFIWDFGKVAIFIHAFYSEMMPEFWALLQNIPTNYDLFITTSTEADQASIRKFLSDHAYMGEADVRVVEQNRGRDMSSLFITFRDVIASDKYKVALRLHSKRTPQVSRQVGESFKDHLFDNLVGGPGYIANILDMMEAEPDIGLVIPPIIHIGFGTLGHSWYNNRKGVMDLLEDMEIEIPLDEDTPVAPYGTMYWFRTDALRKMFEWNWKWDDYNAEPNHVDGGLAHVQERVIAYIAQAAGYRTMSVMNAQHAARNYAHLEYKLQLLASYLKTGNIYFQREELRQGRLSAKAAIDAAYFNFVTRYPGLHPYVRPAARKVAKLLRLR